MGPNVSYKVSDNALQITFDGENLWIRNLYAYQWLRLQPAREDSVICQHGKACYQLQACYGMTRARLTMGIVKSVFAPLVRCFLGVFWSQCGQQSQGLFERPLNRVLIVVP